MTLPNVITVQNMRESDSATIAGGVPSAELMYRAALGIFNAVRFTGKVAIVCGSGNNGGDGVMISLLTAFWERASRERSRAKCAKPSSLSTPVPPTL